MVRPSQIASRRWESRRSLRQRARLGRTPTSSASLAQSAANVWITSSSSMSVTCAACCRLTFTITTRRERISRSTRIVRRAVRYTHPLRARLFPSRRSVVCIIATNGSLLNCPVATVQGRRLQRGTCSALQVRHSNVLAPKARPRWLGRGRNRGSTRLTRNCHSPSLVTRFRDQIHFLRRTGARPVCLGFDPTANDGPTNTLAGFSRWERRLSPAKAPSARTRILLHLRGRPMSWHELGVRCLLGLYDGLNLQQEVWTGQLRREDCSKSEE